MSDGARRAGVAGAIALGVGLLAAGLLRISGTGGPATAGRLAPRFVASTIDSLPVVRSLDDYAGIPIVLNVWATWCDPCRDEMPSLQTLQQDYRSKGLRVVAVSVDDASQDPLIREFVQEYHLTFDVLHDAKADIMQQYQVRGVPQTFLVSRASRIFATRFGGDWSSAPYRMLVDSLLDADAGSPR